MTDSHFNKEEFDFMSNAELLLRKRVIQEKVFQLLEKTQHEIDTVISPELKSQFPSGKISRGENYRGLPYLILDHPAHFRIDDIFACRTMFLWGNFFSTTIHLEGKHLEDNRAILADILTDIDPTHLYTSCGKTPWHYHYEVDNYTPFRAEKIAGLANEKFVKVSKKINLQDYADLSQIAKEFYKPFLSKLKIQLRPF